tara:strand:+ start:694 stop:975 length:282 start_codon:yes stop_codon:yes gene_type:complete
MNSKILLYIKTEKEKVVWDGHSASVKSTSTGVLVEMQQQLTKIAQEKGRSFFLLSLFHFTFFSPGSSFLLLSLSFFSAIASLPYLVSPYPSLI